MCVFSAHIKLLEFCVLDCLSHFAILDSLAQDMKVTLWPSKSLLLIFNPVFTSVKVTPYFEDNKKYGVYLKFL